MHIRNAVEADCSSIKQLYRYVAGHSGGLARTESEITDEYIQHIFNQSSTAGMILVVEHPDKANELIGEIHAYRPGPKAFDHVLSHLTIAIHPDFQGKKVGRTLMTIFLEEIGLHHPEIGKVELITRESNQKAIRFYQSLGFLIEGRMEMRIKSADGCYEADIPMGWQNPNFEF